MLNKDSINVLLTNPCCNCRKDCSSYWSRGSITAAREDLLETNKSIEARLNYIRGLMVGMQVQNSEKFRLQVNNRRVCARAFECWWGISPFYRLKIKRSIIKNASIRGVHKNSSIHRDFPAERLVYGFLSNFIKYCEHQPDSNEVHTMQSIRKIEIFYDFQKSLEPTHEKNQIPSSTTFYRVWRKNFSHLKIPNHNRLGKCDVCCDFDNKILAAKGKRQQTLRQAKSQHRKSCDNERRELSALHERARDDPKEWTSILTDWSNPFLLPHAHERPKGWLSMKRLKYHLFGLVNYATKQLVYYPHLDNWKHDANLHISFLFVYLRQLSDENMLGNNLMLQMDNCWKDNKNKWFFGFMTHLVESRWFKSVEIYYLPPGHSHDMVDRECFRPLGHQMRSLCSFWTPEQFRSVFVARAFKKQRRKPVFLDNVAVWDWKKWMEPAITKMNGQSFQRAFQITFQDDKPVLFYKKSCLNSDWHGVPTALTTGLQILKDSLSGQPDRVPAQPIPQEELEDILKLPALPAAHLPFWTSFINESQFDEFTFGFPSESIGNDFWGTKHYFSSEGEEESELEEEDRLIRIPNHPVTINFDELKIPSIVAILPSSAYYAENPEETPELWWLGRVIQKISGRNRRKLKIQWYKEINSADENLPRKYKLIDGTKIIPFDSIIMSGITLKSNCDLPAALIRKLQKITEIEKESPRSQQESRDENEENEDSDS